MSRAYLARASGACGGLEAVRDELPKRETVIAEGRGDQDR
jgi:hypothetical protein